MAERSEALLRAEAREYEVGKSSSIMVEGRFVRTHNSMSIEGYLARISRSVGEVNVVEAEEEFNRIPISRYESVVGVFTDGHIEESMEEGFRPRRSDDWSYVAVVTEQHNPSENMFRPYNYYLLIKDHTRDDIQNLIDKLRGNKLQVK